MAVEYTWNYTPASSTTGVGAYRANYETEFVRRELKQNNQALLANITSPPDAVETVRFAYQPVANVYSGTRIDPSLYATSKAGCSILAQNATALIGQDAETGYRIILPVSAHLVLKVPNHPAVTGPLMVDVCKRLIGLLATSGYDTDAESMAARFAALARGAVLPRQLI